MARMLFAWELGAHLGHLRRDMPVAVKLREAGHEVLFAVRDLTVAAKVLTPAEIPFVQAPFFTGRAPLRRRPANYAELLLAEGYAGVTTLLGLVQSWLRLFELFRLDVLVADHSPTAMIAARTAGISVVQLGCSFSIPAQAQPMPKFDLDSRIPDETLLRAERHVLTNINAVIRQAGSAAVLDDMAGLFDTRGSLLACFEEFDHYGARSGARYIGPIFTPDGATECSWQSAGGKKIFAYLHGDVPGTEALLEALSEVDAEVVAVVTAASLARSSGPLPRIRFYSTPVRLQPLLNNADLVVSNGGGALSSQALLAGVPLLMLPGHMEQFVQSKCVTRLGAGVTLGMQRDKFVIGNELTNVLSGRRYRDGALDFSRRYAGFDSAEPLQRAVQVISKAAAAEALH